MRDRTITVVAGSAREGRCRQCRVRILWVTVAADRGRAARSLPFDAPAPMPLRRYRTDTGVVFEVWPRLALHFESCGTPATRRRSAVLPAVDASEVAHAR